MGSPVSVCRDIRLGGWGSVLGVCDRGVRLAARVASATTTLAALKHYSHCQPKNDALAGVFLGGGGALPIWFCCVPRHPATFTPRHPRTSLPLHLIASRRTELPTPAPRRAIPRTPHCHATAPRRPPRIAPPPASVPAVCSCPDIPASNLGAPSASNPAPPPPATRRPLRQQPKKFRKYFGWVTGIGGLNVVALLIMDLWPINPRPKSAAAAASPPCSNADPFCLRLLD